jgi:plastocyanin
MMIATRWVILTAALGLAACAGLPATSRTGAVHEILITDDGIAPQDLIVQAGDEVRWINRRAVPIWVSFYEDSLDELSCRRGFSYYWALEETANIPPGGSVSLCFAHEDAISYRVHDRKEELRGSSAGAGGSEIIPEAMHAAIIVEVVR